MNRVVKTLVLTCFLVATPPAALADSITAGKLLERLDNGTAPLVLDVRSKEEYDTGHVPGAVHIPYGELSSRLSELPGGEGQEIVVYCEVGGRAAVATKVLENAGYSEVRNLEGHMQQWRAENLPRE